MKLKSLVLLSSSFLLCSNAFYQSLKEQFAQAFTKGDTTAEINILTGWSKSAHDDPDRYVDLFNYYVTRGLTEVMSLSKNQGNSDAFILKDKSNKTAGYLGTTTSFNEIYIEKGLACIDSAIGKFPTRLDMRFGKVYVLGRIFDYDKFTREIILAIDYGQTIHNKWLWRGGEPMDDPEKFMLSTIQAYIVQLYNIGNGQMGNMQKLALAVLKYFPDNVECLSDISITYMAGKEYEKAIAALSRAEKIAPQDYIVLNNIAYCYEQQGDKPNAIKYYGLVKKYGDDIAKSDADKKLLELNKN